MVVPNTFVLYPCPSTYLETFVFQGRRYFLTGAKALISEYGRYGFCPPIGRGFYYTLPKKDYKTAKALFIIQKEKFVNALTGDLNKGVKKIQNSLF